jgi:hypothetical protein
MLLHDDEIRYDFGGAQFDLQRDAEQLRWVFSQFLYGEVTGIQVGHWIYHAPDLERAQFLVRQCAQELAHVRIMRTILERLGVEPRPAHPMVRFLATGLMGASWDEHVCLEMALGEGHVLTVMLSLLPTLPDPEIQKLLEIAARQEATHVAFGEAQTAIAARTPRQRAHLLGLSLLNLWGVRRLAAFLERRVPRQHPVWAQVGPFTRHVVSVAELRLQRMGLADGPLAAIPRHRRAWLLAAGLGTRTVAPLQRRKLITSTYLRDPSIARPSPASPPS